MPAIGVDKIKSIVKAKGKGGARDLKVQLAVQSAPVRTNNPGDPALLGNSHVANGEWVSNVIDITGTTGSAQYVRFGIAYAANSDAGEAYATVSLEVFLQVEGEIVGTKTLQLIAPDTSFRYAPVTDWVPAMAASKVKAAIVITEAAANFKVGLAYQLATTSIEQTGNWTACTDSTAGTGERNTGELVVTTSSDEAWVRFGFRYKMDSGSDGQCVATAAVGIRH